MVCRTVDIVGLGCGVMYDIVVAVVVIAVVDCVIGSVGVAIFSSAFNVVGWYNSAFKSPRILHPRILQDRKRNTLKCNC